MIKNNAQARVQKSAEQLERELYALREAYDKLKEAFAQLSGGKLPAGLLEDGDGGGVSSAELERERSKVTELEDEVQQSKQDNESLRQEITTLQDMLNKRDIEVEELKKDFEVKDLEVKALQSKLKGFGEPADEELELVDDVELVGAVSEF